MNITPFLYARWRIQTPHVAQTLKTRPLKAKIPSLYRRSNLHIQSFKRSVLLYYKVCVSVQLVVKAQRLLRRAASGHSSTPIGVIAPETSHKPSAQVPTANRAQCNIECAHQQLGREVYHAGSCHWYVSGTRCLVRCSTSNF